MKKSMLISIFSAVLLICSGCQSWKKADVDARSVALITSKQVLSIKENLKIKIAAERNFYNSQLNTVEKSGVRFDENDLVRKSIRNAQQQADELINSDGSISSGVIAAQLLNNSTNLFEELHAIRNKRREQREVIEKCIRELQLLESQYEDLNQTLIQLTTPPGTRDQMAHVAAFIKGVADNYKQLENAAGTNVGNN